jgi:hypothetical protein
MPIQSNCPEAITVGEFPLDTTLDLPPIEKRQMSHLSPREASPQPPPISTGSPSCARRLDLYPLTANLQFTADT